MTKHHGSSYFALEEQGKIKCKTHPLSTFQIILAGDKITPSFTDAYFRHKDFTK
jgi:hypothetical protein